jgi:FkbM family methyltransferase
MIRDLIYDVGMNSGQDTEFYLKKGFRVIAVDADLKLCQSVANKFSHEIKSGRLKILNLAIDSSDNQMVDFYINPEHNEWSSLHLGTASRSVEAVETVKVRTASMLSLIKEYGIPYYLKIDIEGNDYVALASALKAPTIPYISVENGFGVLSDLSNKGYDSFKMIQQNDVQNQKQANPATEGRDVDYEFPFGSSGKFGSETDGEWLNFSEIEKTIDNIWSRKRSGDWDDNLDGWFDLHARHKDWAT